MFCSKCGNQIPDGTNQCPNCVQTTPAQGAVVTVESHLVEAILTTLFCCVPFGIVAIVYAAQVSDFVANGKIAAAQEASQKAHKWSMISLAVGLGGILLYILFYAIFAIVFVAAEN